MFESEDLEITEEQQEVTPVENNEQDENADDLDSIELPEENREPIQTSFGTVTGRLAEIAEAMEDETMPLDDALKLLEEAVSLGMQASTLLESDMAERDASNAEEEDTEGEESSEAETASSQTNQGSIQ